jgi:hypothetical protein
MEPKKSVGRKALTPQEKKAREDFLLNEKPTARTKRVLNPQLKRVFKQTDRIISAVKSPRYVFTEEQKKKILETFAEKYTLLESAFKSKEQTSEQDIL